ncbi:MAG: alpha/beta hydrolase [Omnitrophica bacterium]|nr:alpha/beta hydrolase [Candidatus Omnitrophota bacterium]
MLKVIVYIIVLVLVIFGYVRFMENRIIFYPMKGLEFTPKLIALPFENIYINTRDNVRIHGWFIPAENQRGTFLFFHGNAGNIGHRLEKILVLHKMQLNIFIIDYRGYGLSQGRPSEKGMYLDAKAAYDYLVNKRGLGAEKIMLYGESLGTAAAVDLASKEQVGGLIIESGFSRGKDMAKKIYPYLPEFFFTNNFDSISKIKKVKAPKLIIHSKNDEIVPFRLARKLYEAAGAPKEFTELIGAHNTVFLDSREKYLTSIASFISACGFD